MELRRIGRTVAFGVLMATIGAMAAGGVAWAVIPDSGTGVVTACYNPNGRAAMKVLKVVDAQAGGTCAKGWVPLSWNQQGPKGDQGDPGPSNLYTSSVGGVTADPQQWTNLGTLSLPAGSYQVSSHFTLVPPAGGASLACGIGVPGNTPDYTTTGVTTANRTVMLESAVTLAAPGTVTVDCYSYLPQSTLITYIHFDALAVETLTTQ
jgi:hypothetical protein